MPRPRKPKLQPKSGGYILGMHLGDVRTYFQTIPHEYKTLDEATKAAKEKHAKYGRNFSVYLRVATTHIEPSAVQLELFK